MKTMLMIRMTTVATMLAAGSLFAGCPCQNQVQVHNNTLVPITEVYLRHDLAQDWGDNRISGNILPGETETVGNLIAGCYDVRLVYFGGGDSYDEACLFCEEETTVIDAAPEEATN